MKFHLHKAVLTASVILASAGLAACSNSDDEPAVSEIQTPGVVNPSNVFTGKMPVNVGGTSFVRNAEGLVTEIRTTDGKTITFTYLSYSRMAGDDSRVVMAIDYYGDRTVYDLTIGSNGFVSKSYVKMGEPGDHEYEEGEWQFTYDAEGHLLKGIHTYIDYYGAGNYSVNLRWENGNIVKTWKDGEEEDWDSYTYSYTSAEYPTMLENKGALFMFESIYPVEVYEFEWLYYAGMLGKGPRNLAVSRTEVDEDGSYTEYFTWTLDENGYPTMFDVKDDDHPGESTVRFTWN